MNGGTCWKLGCLLLFLCSACGDDDQGNADQDVTSDEPDGGGAARGGARAGDEGEPTDEPGSTGGAGGGRDEAPSDAGEGSVPGMDAAVTDAGTPPPATAGAGGTEVPSDAAVGGDASAVTDCESLAACCEQLSDRRLTACENAIEAADDTACAAFARRACPAGDGGQPAQMPCEAVLECCAALEGREQSACEAAATVPEGRACDRALETYCR